MKPYTAPVIEEMVAKQEEVLPTVKTVVEEEPVTNTLKADSDLTKNYFSAADRHFQYLNKELGFSTKKDPAQEQISFMAITGRSLSYDYDEFEKCALYLVQKMRESEQLVAEGRFLRFSMNVEQYGYPAIASQNYKLYTTYLARIAKGWTQRSKIAKLGDIATLAKNFPAAAQDNLNLFMRRLISFKI